MLDVEFWKEPMRVSLSDLTETTLKWLSAILTYYLKVVEQANGRTWTVSTSTYGFLAEESFLKLIKMQLRWNYIEK